MTRDTIKKILRLGGEGAVGWWWTVCSWGGGGGEGRWVDGGW